MGFCKKTIGGQIANQQKLALRPYRRLIRLCHVLSAHRPCLGKKSRIKFFDNCHYNGRKVDFRPHGIILGVDLFMSDSTNHSYFDQNQNAGRPVIFQQVRVGKEGKLFTMYKFRSMQVIHSGSSISIAGESRITPLGAV